MSFSAAIIDKSLCAAWSEKSLWVELPAPPDFSSLAPRQPDSRPLLVLPNNKRMWWIYSDLNPAESEQKPSQFSRRREKTQFMARNGA
jgi:hypothetical protein